MPEGIFSHFTIHIFFTICEALFHDICMHFMASIVPPMSILPYHRAENRNFIFLFLKHCHSTFLDIGYGFLRMFLKDFDVLFDYFHAKL